MNVVELLEHQKIPFEPKEDDHVYIDCWKCGKDNLSINVFTGAWHCWSLGCEDIKGGFNMLAKELDFSAAEFEPVKAPIKIKIFTDDERNAIENSKNNKTEIIEWAITRALDPEFVMKQGVGYDAEKKAIVFPYRDEKGNLIGARYRSVFYSTQWVVGREPDLYVLDYADIAKEKCIIAEGEIDELTLKQMGFPCVAILGSRKDEGYKMLRRVRQLYLGHDMDGAGEAGAEKAATLLGRYRCKRAKWTQKDPNAMLQAGATKEDFIECLAEAYPMATDLKSSSAATLMKEMLDEKKRQKGKRLSWGWDGFDKMTKGILPGWCIYIMARGNAGKTTFLLNLLFNIKDQGVRGAIASYEEDPVMEVTPKVIAMEIGRNPGTGEFDPREIELAEPALEQIHMWNLQGRSPDDFCDWVRECYYVHGVRFVVADYLQMVVDTSSDQALLNSCYKVGKDLCKELPGLNIVWAVQPKLLQKTMHKGEKVVAKIDGSDARGGSVIEQACDVFVVFSMVQGDTNLTQFELTKVRGQLSVHKQQWLGVTVKLRYFHDTLRQVEEKESFDGN